ncbi:MAG TPA: YdcF family protein [Dokdonella sp.]|uniref:YdcF family protein n=1 Tax=Dokdonella sp. TaxID=2291710 RepID=UPI0025BF08BC|nr:YdcF family protein [Dokdonella sp.]MBX3691829.1 YdcF family protein [Dokdonella sp.]MCW5568938.1 YdcF family protein [Dokdonella sp.]HNR92379.1 YdcF family protein [Dokdonella sp.]
MLSSLVSPLRFGVLFALLALLLWRWLPRPLRMLVIIVSVGCLALTTPLVANTLVGWQEARVPAMGCPAGTGSTIVVLGGGVSREARGDDDFSALTEASLRRLFAGVALARAQPDALLLISGGVSRFAFSESGLMGALARQLGVAPERLRLEHRSRTTWQNARYSSEMQPPIARHIVLVTSALHMPRARYAFEQAGFEVCAWPVDYRHAPFGGVGYFLPSTTGLLKADLVLHELVGEAAYRLGWLRDTTRDPHRDAGEG